MHPLALLMILLSILVLGGCSGRFGQRSHEQQTPHVVFRPADADTILSCLAESQRMTRKEYKGAFTGAQRQQTESRDDGTTLRWICLNLHPLASSKQVKEGMTTLSRYIKNHPETAAGLQGLYQLLQRVEREKTARLTQSNKSSDEKETLESENKELVERNGQLEQTVEQDRSRIGELERQIEQLKNIENIIKNRER
jgi:hypothetical protein